MRRFLKNLIVIACIVCTITTLHFDARQCHSGTANSIGGIVTPDAQAFILSEFGDAESPVALGHQLLAFALENFTYDKAVIGFVQIADTHRFIFENDFRGVCLDFATFAKTVFCVIREEKGWDNVGCYVALTDGEKGQDGHALNYITVENPDGTVTIYELDLTFDLSRFQHQEPLRALSCCTVAPSREQVESTIETSFPIMQFFRAVHFR